ncbi:STAS domain-containing protein [Carboxylicivirga sp. N1Y90]|uniref:STAS domain-containing protein n=1 Tax=Carboxylicivirga fragile TaxID=3417571 RepID=UPI003D33DA22|nr:STAS domain-containing protein [Marinilabiliaceae bacterium N1Y90]
MLEFKEQSGLIIGSLVDTDRLNATVASEVKTELTDVLSKSGTKLLINLSNVKFIDSTGIGVLISALKTARQHNGSLYLCSIQSQVMSLLSLMKLDKIFEIYKNEEDVM